MRRLALVLLLLLAAPAAAQAEPPFSAEVRFHAPPQVEGAVDVRAAEGALDLGAAQGLVLSWGQASGRFVESNWTVLPAWRNEDTHSVAPVAFGRASLRVLDCGANCTVLLVSSGRGSVGLAGWAQGSTAWREEPADYCASFCDNDGPTAYRYLSGRGAFLAAGGPAQAGALAVRDAEARAEGTLGLLVRDASVEVDDAQGAHVLDARVRFEAPLVVGWAKVRSAFLYLDLEGASLKAPTGTPALLMADAPEVALQGSLASSSASGRVAYAGQDVAFDHAPFSFAGAANLSFQRDGAALVPLAGGPVEPRADAQGMASEVVVGDQPLVPAPVLATAARSGAWVAVLLAAAFLLQRLALVSLYSRMSADRVLHHPNRVRILALLRETPGLTVREIRERTGLARIVVQHHLAVLSAHRMVRKTTLGRANRHHATDAPPQEGALEAALALKDGTRRQLAQAVAAAGGATQRDLVQRTGLSQRLVSYHLARLSRTRLVDADEGIPKRYRPTPLLLERLRGTEE